MFSMRMFTQALKVVRTKHWDVIETRASAFLLATNNFFIFWIYVLVLFETMPTKAHTRWTYYFTI